MPLQLDTGIPLAARGFTMEGNPFAQAFAGAQQLQQQRAAQQALIAQRDAAVEQRKQEMAKAARDQFEEESLAKLFGSGQPIDPKQVYSIVGPKRGADILKGISALQEQGVKTEGALRAHVGTILGGIESLPPNLRPQAYTLARNDFITKGYATAEQIPEQYTPEYIAGARKWALTPKEQFDQEAQAARDKIAADAAAAALPGIKADATVKQAVAAGTSPTGITAAQAAQNANAAANTRIAAGNLAVAQTREKREGAAATAAQADVTELTPEGLDAAAMMFAKTGQLPALGMGDKQTRKKIINRAAALIPGLDIASAKADYGANTASLQNVTKTLDTLTAFENTAGKNLDQFLSLASKIPDTGVPWLNTPIRALNISTLGSEQQAAANAARVVALREIARVTNDPKLSGVLSDAARAEVSSLSPENATFAQIRAVAKTLKADMANVHSSLSDQRDAITGRLKRGSSADMSTIPVHAVGDMVIGPDGKPHKVLEVSPDGKKYRLAGD